MKRWRVAEAKARLSAVLHESANGPQLICSRDKPVAVILSIEAYERATAKGAPSIREMLKRLRKIQKTETVEIDLPPRVDREVSFPSDE